MDSQEHKQKVKKSFDMASDRYDCSSLRFFVNSALYLVNILDLKGNENLLDIATGTGNIAIAAAQKLANGHVTGIDISEKMLEKGRSKINEKKLTNVTFKCCDIEDMGFEESSFDVACCAFGLFFLPDMERGLNCISKVIKPGGKFSLTSFTGDLMEPLNGIFLDRLKGYGIKLPPLSWKRLDTPDKIDGLLSSTGFQDVNIQSKQMGYFLKGSSEWWNVLWNSGYRGLLSQLSEKDLHQFKKDHLNEIDQFAVEKDIWLNVEVLFTISKISSVQ